VNASSINALKGRLDKLTQTGVGFQWIGPQDNNWLSSEATHEVSPKKSKLSKLTGEKR